MISWATINTFGFPIGLFLLRNGWGYYQSFRSAYHSRKDSIRPLSSRTSIALNLLFASAILFLISTLPFFSPHNIFRETEGRLQTSNEVLFNRLSVLRPLSPLDTALKAKLTSKEARLYYFAYGPRVVAECTFCTPDNAMSYLYYALPSLLGPHVIHTFLLGIATSSMITSPEAARWRGYATSIAIALAAGEVYLTAAYDIRYNTRSTHTRNIDFFFWNMRIYRGLAIAATDAILGWVIWLAATNRFFITQPTVVQRLDTLIRAVESSNGRLWATGNVRNTVVRDRELREKVARYWNEEKGLYEEREVVDAIQGALTRIDIGKLANIAEQRAGDVVEALKPQRPPA